MSAVLGVSLLSLAALWFAAILPVYRRPAPPRWATIALVAELMTVGILSVGVFGLAFLVQFALTAATQGFSLLDGALVLAVVVGAGLLWRRLPARRHVTAARGP
jgi:ABC-type phosphate transport system permease subunit